MGGNHNKYKVGEKMKLSVKKLNLLLANRVMSIEKLSKESEVSKVTLSRMKAGTQEPRPQTLGKIARALGVKVEDLLED